ncbi:DUF1636 family protein [Alloyangia pacifica]|uniref:DUF1636 family protein n=1 Tax=Alloyangia pacifica TaxID=311180 RepID=UPI001CD45837|nr:DUF1636 domain-containing protein [Alloyangia pacifica]MCA0994987.1 DUF1636 domain-containing protein [Alloyangia pacifica]
MNNCAHTQRVIERTEADSELLVCVKCRPKANSETPGDNDGLRPGRRLYDALLAAGAPEGVRLRAVECLQNCDAGCTAALRGGAGKWTYVYGNLESALAGVLLEGARAYHAAPDGLIPWRQRPDHFKRNCVARIPPAEFPDPLEESDT